MSEPATGPVRRPDDLPARLAGFLIRLLMSALVATCRVRVVQGGEHLDALRAAGRPTVIAFWHDRLFYLTHFLYSRFVRRGYPLVGPHLALPRRRLRRTSRPRPRRPRGPRLDQPRRQRRPARPAARDETGLLPGHGRRRPARPPPHPQARRRHPRPPLRRPSPPPLLVRHRVWTLRSWDRMQIPKPFSTVHIALAPPIPVPPGHRPPALHTHLAETLDHLQTLADQTLPH